MSQLATVQTPPIPQRQSLINLLGSKYNVEPAKLLSTLKDTVFKNATDSQLMALCIVANEYGLNPFTKEIYAFPGKNGEIVPVVSVDGWVKMLNRQEQFDGIEFELDQKDDKPVACTSVIYIKGRSRPVKITEYFSECSRNTDPWNKSPRRMLRHKALIQGARVAFGFSGIHDDEEAQEFAAKPLQAVEVRSVSLPQKTLPSSPIAEVVEKVVEAISTQEADQEVVVERATPAQGIANLCKASGVSETDLIAFLKTKNACNPAAVSLDQVPEVTLTDLQDNWPAILIELQQQKPAEQGNEEASLKDQLTAKIRTLLEDGGFTEDQLIAFLKKKKHITKATVTTLSEINESRLNWCIEFWGVVKPHLAEA